MKKIKALGIAVTMAFALSACDSNPLNPSTTKTNTATPPAGASTSEETLSNAITVTENEEYIYFNIKTSKEFDAHRYSLDIVNQGVYLNRDSEFITQCIYNNSWAFDEKFDREWFDGIYVFYANKSMIEAIASDAKYAPGTWSVLLFNEDSRDVLGEWNIVLEGDGKYHFDFKNSWLYGAGEDKKSKEFETLSEEVASWFEFKAEECYDEWAYFTFDGYLLENVDPQGYDNYYLMVCPEGDYVTYAEADEVDLTYGGYGGIDYAKCPYHFGIEQNGIEPGKYTMVLVRDGRNDLGVGGYVEVQFDVEKTNAKNWTMDFTNAKCPALDSKYTEKN